MRNLPGMKVLDLKKQIPVYKVDMLPPATGVNAAYDPKRGRVSMSQTLYGKKEYEPILAHELGHATMHQAGDIGASNLFYDWRQPGKRPASKHMAQGATDYLRGKNAAETPAEFAAYLLGFVRSNKGSHPILHKKGTEAGVKALIGRMRAYKGSNSPLYKTIADWIEGNAELRQDVVQFFQKYAANNVVEDGGGFTVRDQAAELT